MTRGTQEPPVIISLRSHTFTSPHNYISHSMEGEFVLPVIYTHVRCPFEKTWQYPYKLGGCTVSKKNFFLNTCGLKY